MQKNNFALVTGAASGIGRAYTLELAQSHAGVIVVDRNAEALQALVEEVAATGAQVVARRVDLTEEQAAGRLFAWTEQEGLEVGTLVCNAGALLFGGFATLTPEQIERLLALHCGVTAQLCRLFGAAMRARKERGHILVMSSATAYMPYPSIVLYAATKSYLKCFAEALHDEWAADGVVVTVVCPGAVDTPFYRLDERMRRRLLFWRVMHGPQQIAHRALRALWRGKKRILPGFFTKLCVALCRICPSALIRWTVRRKRIRRLLE